MGKQHHCGLGRNCHANVPRSLWMAFRLLLATVGGIDGGTATWENGLRVLKGRHRSTRRIARTWARASVAKTLIVVVGFLAPGTDSEEGKLRSAGKWFCVGYHEKAIIARAKAGANWFQAAADTGAVGLREDRGLRSR